MIEPNHPTLSVRRQCTLLGLPRASYYCKPATESNLNLELMRLMGLSALYPRPKTSLSNKEHPVHPYLLRDVAIVNPQNSCVNDYFLNA